MKKRKTRRPPGHGSMDTLPSGRVRVRISVRGQRRTKMFDSRGDADLWVRQQLARGGAGGSRPNATLRDLYEFYLQEQELRENTDSTIKGNRSHMSRVLEYFGELRLREIDTRGLKVVKKLMIDLGWSNNTINNRLSCITTLYRAAAEEGWVEERPLRVRRMRVTLDSRPDPYSCEEVQRLSSTAAEQGDPRFLAAVRLAGLAGLRASALLRFRRSDVRDRAIVLPVRSATDQPKGKRERLVPVPPAVLEAILACPATGEERVIDQGWKHVSGLHHWLETVWSAAGAGGVRLHRLRHFWCCAMATCGATPFELQTWGGWSTVGAMSRYYHHPIDLTPEFRRMFAVTIRRARDASILGTVGHAMVTPEQNV